MIQAYLDPFGIPVNLATTSDEWVEIQSRMKGRDRAVPSSPGHTRINFTKDGVFEVSVWLSKEALAKGGGRYRVDICSHEAVHVIRFVLEHIGEWTKTHEIEAYLIGFVASWLWEQVA